MSDRTVPENRLPAPRCGHGRAHLRITSADRAVCGACGSFWDLRSIREQYRYDESYPTQRGHDSPIVGAAKVQSLQRWLRDLELDLRVVRVCEIGFGGGWPLQFLHDVALDAYGVEAVDRNITSAVNRGMPSGNVFHVDRLPERLPHPVDLWVYLDSFEHIPDPASHIQWVSANSSAHCAVLLVLPDASSASARLLGRWWPHRLPDHDFHWTRDGLQAIWSSAGFSIARSFSPVKRVTTGMVLRHAANMIGRDTPPALATAGPALWFNVGEQGLLFRR